MSELDELIGFLSDHRQPVSGASHLGFSWHTPSPRPPPPQLLPTQTCLSFPSADCSACSRAGAGADGVSRGRGPPCGCGNSTAASVAASGARSHRQLACCARGARQHVAGRLGKQSLMDGQGSLASVCCRALKVISTVGCCATSYCFLVGIIPTRCLHVLPLMRL